ncbi:MAG: protein BatD, partial [bacterium]
QADISIELAVNELSVRSVSAETSAALKSLLETCEMARFAPTILSVDVMKKTYDDASRIIIELERTL